MLFPQNDIFPDFRWHESFFFYFSFLVQRYKSAKKILKLCWSVKTILKPTRASRTLQDFYSINPDMHFVLLNVISSKCLDDMIFFLFSVSSTALQKRVKKILKPAYGFVNNKRSAVSAPRSSIFSWRLI